MPIQLLPARLANQIAAGEVVERPASVIKELVENALDAGATRIDIEVEKGGSKLIRIRDNGSGIVKAELELALSRHATSKIASFDDLENITSLGFRGEALASISSVSRLTLTSKPPQQSEAWQAYAEGRDMEVRIIPAAHPDGTTIEVVDLFFNTPARRKFLRAEKTEFYHIDELIKRIALSRFDVHFSLKHNGKIIRNLPRALEQSQKDKRVGLICSKSFAESAVHLACDHQGIELSGYVALPNGCRAQNDIQYSYVNGRMMRDKLINHAIRQAYGQQLSANLYPAYILYLSVDPKQIDVNVHPAKHEVRFHQARLVHDFIVQALEQALVPTQSMDFYELEEVEPEQVFAQASEPTPVVQTEFEAPPVIQNNFVREPEPAGQLYPGQVQSGAAARRFESTGGYSQSGQGGQSYRANQPSKKQLEHYHQALASFTQPIAQAPEVVVHSDVEAKPMVAAKTACLSVLASRFALYQYSDEVFLLDLAKVNGKVAASQHPDGLIGQPLLLPVKLPLGAEDLDWLAQQGQRINRLGIEFECLDTAVVIRKVPGIIRDQNVVEALTSLFAQMNELSDQQSVEWLYCRYCADRGFDLMAATQLLGRARELLGEQEMLQGCGVSIDMSCYIEELAKRH